MCLGAVGDAIGDAFSSVDKVANSLNPFKGITDWGTENTLAKIPGIGKPLGQLADWGDSHPAEVGAAIGAGFEAAPYLAGEGAAAPVAADGTAMGPAAGTLGAVDSTAASGDVAGSAVPATSSGFGGVGVDAGVASPGSFATANLLKYGATAAKVIGPSLVNAAVNAALAPKLPKAAAPVAMPDPLAQEQAQRQKIIAQLARRGRASTILTSATNGSLGG